MRTEELDLKVFTVVGEIVRRKSGTAREIAAEQRLVGDLGLRSLDLAELVAQLEFDLNLDPFSNDATIADMRTVGDLCAAYRKCHSRNASTP